MVAPHASERDSLRYPTSKGEILLVATSSASLPNNGSTTGAWLPEIAAPYCIFVQNGYDVTIASPKGGQVPVDPASLSGAPPAEAELITKFNSNESAQQMMAGSVPLSQVKSANAYSAIFMAGGHGASVDFPNDQNLQQLVKSAIEQGVVVAALCHGNAVFASEGLGRMLAGRRMAVFSDEEEKAVGKTNEVPFLLETRLRDLGIVLEEGAPNSVQVVVDGNIATGQNPASSAKLAQEVVRMLGEGGPGRRSSHPGTMTAAEVPQVLGIAPILPTSAMEEDVAQKALPPMEPYQVNLGPGAFPDPATNAGNDAPAGA